MIPSIEVLAPAGGRAALDAALRAGADAVYFGAGRFNARGNAENFSDDALRAAVADCRERGVRAYLTLNILVGDAELPEALALARDAAEAGVDGLIVQDLGLARALRGCLPDTPLHASTQLSVHTPAALPLLRELGFARVVAARELSAGQLRELCAAAADCGMSVEVFAHGALCMCLSGQCYLSAMLGGRSGNRGLCAGPCRLPFCAPGGTGHDLSLRDLSLLPHVEALREMGVASLKIEGRMKRPEYVAAATAALRSAVDTGEVPQPLQQALRQVFSRTGFTDGYFTGRLGREMFGVRTREDAAESPAAHALLHEIYRAERPRVAVRAALRLTADADVTLSLSDGAHTVTATGPRPEPARSREADVQSLRTQCEKLGGTPYFLADFSAQIDPGLFVPAASVNALRRDAVSALGELRRRPGAVRIAPVSLRPPRRPDARPAALLARFSDPAQLPEPAALQGVRAVCLPVETDFSALPRLPVPVLAHLPRGMANEAPWLPCLQRAAEAGVRAVLCGNLSSLALARRAGLLPVADFGLNLYNSEALAAAEALGAAAAVVSFELTLPAAKRLSAAIPTGLFAYGRQPLMLTRNCPIANGTDCAACDGRAALTDRRRAVFPVRCRGGYSELLNSNVLWLADRADARTGFDFLVLSFTTESPAEAAAVLRAYQTGGPPPAGYTRGLADRGVL